MVSAMKLKAFLCDLISWDILTTFQKIILVFVVLTVISYLTGTWSAFVVMILSFPLASALSEKLHRRKTPIGSDVVLITVHYVKVIISSFEILLNKPEPKSSDSDHCCSTDKIVHDDEVSLSEIVKAERSIADLIVRDFVKSWFSSFSDESQFLEESRNILYVAAANCHHRVSTLKAHDLVFSSITLFYKHLRQFQKSKVIYESHKKTLQKNKDKCMLNLKYGVSLEEAFSSNFQYHPALADSDSEIKYLRSLAKAALMLVLPDNVYVCQSSQIVFIEVVAFKILKQVSFLMSDSHWLHEHMIILFSGNISEEPKSSTEEMFLEGSGKTDSKRLGKLDESSSKESCDGLGVENRGKGQTKNIPKVTFNLCDEEGDDGVTEDVEDRFKTNNDDTARCQSSFQKFNDDGKSVCDSEEDINSRNDAAACECNDKKNNSKTSQTTFQTQTKCDTRKTRPKNTTLSDDNGPTIHLREDINEITVPREKNGCGNMGAGDHRVGGNDAVAVECSDEALPVKGNEVIHLSTIDVENAALDCDGDVDSLGADPLLMIKDESLIFQDISIPKTEEFQEFRSNSKYTMYVIEYVALYFSDGNPVLKSGIVKRRFREFVNLQARLDDQSKYRNLLKDVKGPSRWATLPFKNRDKDSIESRRVFLDKFLKGLIMVEAVCNGPELREFLAYEGDGHIAFVRKAPEMSVPRIDKMFARTVSEVFDRLKAIPDIPHNVMSTITKREKSVDREDQKKIEDTVQLEIDFSCSETDQQFEDFEEYISNFSKPENANTTEEDATQEDCQKLLSRLQQQGLDIPDKTVDEGNIFTDIPLTHAAIALAVQALQGREHWLCRDRVIRSLTILIGRALNRWLCDQIDSLTTEDSFVHYLTLVRDTFWPNGHLCTDRPPAVSEETRKAQRIKAKQSLKEFLPGFTQTLAGDSDFDYAVEQIMECLDHEKLNRHFLYTFLDVVMEKLFPELSSQEVQNSLLS